MWIAKGRPWASTTFVVAGLPIAVLTGGVVFNAGLFAILVGLTVVGAPQGRSALFAVSRACTAVQRSRLAGLMGVDLRLPDEGNSRAAWRQVWYHMVIGLLISVLGFSALVGLWATAVVAVNLPVFARPGARLFGQPLGDPITWTALILLGVALAVAAIKLAPALAALEVKVARVMLEPSRAEELAQRVEVLTESRADVVDAADTERRRIERDLHDGAQQRLVSLAMNLGMARNDLTDVDPRARDAIAQAHDEAKLALSELRDLVRGLHPAVLDDRGLDAALSGITARSPVPARLTVDVSKRPSPTIEAVAYFLVSEALSNVAKHAQASSVEILVKRQGSRLLITVRDDGRGGADPSAGTGLRGLAQRVSSVDGKLHVDSPAGGPTVIRAELPCES